MILKRFNVERTAEDPDLIRRLKAEGYEVVSGDMPEPAQPKDLNKLSKDQLVKLAGERGLLGAKSLNKKELLEVLTAEEGDDNGADRTAGAEDPGEA